MAEFGAGFIGQVVCESGRRRGGRGGRKNRKHCQNVIASVNMKEQFNQPKEVW